MLSDCECELVLLPLFFPFGRLFKQRNALSVWSWSFWSVYRGPMGIINRPKIRKSRFFCFPQCDPFSLPVSRSGGGYNPKSSYCMSAYQVAKYSRVVPRFRCYGLARESCDKKRSRTVPAGWFPTPWLDVSRRQQRNTRAVQKIWSGSI